MWRNYIILTFRKFLTNRNFALINIIGLSIGLTACILIFLLIRYDLNFDGFHGKKDAIYRVVKLSKNASGESFSSATPYPFISAFRNDFPDIPLSTQMHYEEEVMLRVDDHKFIIQNAVFADSLFFEVFDFEVVSGNPRVALGQPDKIFITETLARTINYSADQRIKINNLLEVEVAGIIKDAPVNSHIQFSMVVSMSSFTPEFIGGMPLDQWSLTASGYSYIVLPDNMTQARMEEQLIDFAKKYLPKEDVDRKVFNLQPLNTIHFDEQYVENPGNVPNASYKEIKTIAILGAFILAIGCINFINLSTALAVRKAKEIGIRKTLGARRSQLTFYFLGETFFLTLFAVLISLGIIEWLTPWVNDFTEKKISLDLFSNLPLILFLICLVVFTTLVSGFYPALILSGYSPAYVLKNKGTNNAASGLNVRKVLVVFQFIIAQVLIIGTLIIAGQMQYFKTKPLGFEKDAVILLKLPENDTEKMQALRDRLAIHSNILSVSFSLGAPTSDNNFGTNYYLTENTSSEMYGIGVKPVDRFYMETYGITLRAGRWFTEGDEKVADHALPEEQRKYLYIVNESATKTLGFQNPEEILGKNITTGVNRINTEVIGVVHDFHISSLHSKIDPVVLLNFPYFYHEVGVKVSTANLQESISFIREQWSELFPDFYFEYSFLDQKLEKLYRKDEHTFTLIRLFAGVSIFIGCLGLYGLVSFMAHQKMKEVGIRKVMGASVESIVLLFSKGFLKLIVIAFFIAAPLGWYFMQQWLSSYAYHISIHWSVFLISLLVTLTIALATVSYRSVRAAVTNPSETLRTE